MNSTSFGKKLIFTASQIIELIFFDNYLFRAAWYNSVADHCA
jgi:hypothetical protein